MLALWKLGVRRSHDIPGATKCWRDFSSTWFWVRSSWNLSQVRTLSLRSDQLQQAMISRDQGLALHFFHTFSREIISHEMSCSRKKHRIAKPTLLQQPFPEINGRITAGTKGLANIKESHRWWENNTFSKY